MIKLSDVNKDVKVVEGKLHIGSKVVQQYDVPDGASELPQNFCIRAHLGRRLVEWEFVTGFDLCKNGLLWFNGCMIKAWKDQGQMSIPPSYYQHMAYIERIFNELCAETAGAVWEIFPDFPAPYEPTEADEYCVPESIG